MSYQDLLVVLDDTPQCASTMNVAAALARQFDAHVTGLYVMNLPRIPTYVEAQIPPQIFRQQREDAESTMDDVRQRFAAVVESTGIEGEFRSAEGLVDDVVSLQARYVDMTIIGQPNPEVVGSPGTSASLVETLIFETGRPILAVPYAGRFGTVGQRPLIAWSATREAARAVADALPLLKQADAVATLSVNPRKGGQEGTHGDMPGADIARHLARHDVKVEAQHTLSEDVSIGDMLLSAAADESADLIVMGAYGHSRVREMVLGGVTRHLLSHMTVPVLLAH